MSSDAAEAGAPTRAERVVGRSPPSEAPPESARGLLPAEQMAGRVAQAVLAGLEGAWRAGASFVSIVLGEGEASSALDTDAQTEIAEISRQLAVEIVEPVRRRMEAAMSGASDEAAALTTRSTAASGTGGRAASMRWPTTSLTECSLVVS